MANAIKRDINSKLETSLNSISPRKSNVFIGLIIKFMMMLFSIKRFQFELDIIPMMAIKTITLIISKKVFCSIATN